MNLKIQIAKKRKINNGFIDFISKEILLVILLFIFLSGVFGTFGIYFALLLFPLMAFKIRFEYFIDQSFIWILIFSVSYAIFSTLNGFNENARGNLFFFAVYPPLLYIIGRYLMYKWQSQSYFLFLLLVASFAVPTIIDVFRDIIINGFISTSRNLPDEAGIIMSATARGAKVSLSLAALALILSPVINIKERKYQILFVVLGILSLITTLHLLNRTGIVIITLAVLLVILKNIRVYTIKTIIYILLLSSVVIGFFLYPLIKKSDVVESYSKREDSSESGTLSAGGRTVFWIAAIDSLVSRPINGGYASPKKRNYSHNLWLDVVAVAGTIPFLALIVATIINLRKNYYLIRSSTNISRFFVSIIIVLNVGYLLTCMVEPILEGNFIYVFSYFYFWGMTGSLYKKDANTR